MQLHTLRPKQKNNMKKLLFSLFAVLAVLASCTSDDYDEAAVSVDKKYEFGFTVPGVNSDSRALKSSWETGDVVYYAFKNITSGMLKMVYYEGAGWQSFTTGTLTAKEVAENADKQYKAIWVRGQHTLSWKDGYWQIGDHGSEYWESAESNLQYTLDSSDPETSFVIPVSSFTWKMGDYVKVSFEELPEGHWTLYSPNVNPLRGQGINPTALATTKESADVNGRYMSVEEEESNGVKYSAYYGTPDGGANTIFYLTNGEKTYTKSFTKQLPLGKGIKMIGLQGWTLLDESLNGHGYVDLGLMRKDLDPTSTSTTRIMIGDRNLGAENVTDYGLFFRWGELEGWDITAFNEWTSVPSAAVKVSPTGEVKPDAFNVNDTFLYGVSSVADFSGMKNVTAGDKVYGDAATNYWGDGWQMESLLHELTEFKFKSDGDELKVTLGAVDITCTWNENYEGSGVAGFELKNDITWRKTFIPAGGFFYCNNKRVNVQGDGTSMMLFSLLNLGKRNLGAAYWSGKSDSNNYGVASVFANVDFRDSGMDLYETFAISSAREYAYSFGPIPDGRIRINMPKCTMLPIRAFTEINM